MKYDFSAGSTFLPAFNPTPRVYESVTVFRMYSIHPENGFSQEIALGITQKPPSVGVKTARTAVTAPKPSWKRQKL